MFNLNFNPFAVVIAVIAVIIGLVALSVIVMYNRFARQAQLVAESWHGIDVELTRRHDLVPNLVRTVSQYSAYESSLLDQLTRARESAAGHRGDSPAVRAEFEDQLGTAAATVVARAEAYPDLKASANFMALQAELTNTEDRIAAARRFYNGNVRAYNTRVRTFPSNLIASLFKFVSKEFFEADAAHRAVPSS